MAEAAFRIGERVTCSDGDCGRVTRVVLDPVAAAITQLVVEHWHQHRQARLVPVDLAEGEAAEIRLRCTRSEFDSLPPAEERDFVDADLPGYEPDQVVALPYFGLSAMAGIRPGSGMDGEWTRGQGWDPAGSHGPARRLVTLDSVPAGEVQVRRGDRVHATDGEIGRVEGLVIDPDNHHVTHVLLADGHPWGRKDIAIPIGAVSGLELGVRLSISRQQVEELPEVEIDRQGK
jgi:sporulation protein YlmC with PRC-barrel domain